MSRRSGFTLIELLIVMVILGILAAIVIPRFSSTRERAYVSTMKSDLKNLASQQEIYYANTYAYTTSLTDLQATPSDAVTYSVGVATATGWSATATHSGTSRTCAVYYGDAAAVTPATSTGLVTCDGA